jgi:hypothetical protein
MSPIAGRFHFVNKSAQSLSLSHSDAEEKFYIQSYIQSKHQKKPRRTTQLIKQPTTEHSTQQDAVPPPSQATKDFVVVPSSQPPEQRYGRQLHDQAPSCRRVESLTRLSRAVPAGNGSDPFHSTPVTIDVCTYRLLQYPFSGFVETTFRAESLGLQNQASLSPSNFRHRHAVTERLRRCIDDKMVMYATLAYCSSSIRFTKGNIGEERPPEFYILKAIETLRSRLQQPDPVDGWLILSIYALSVSEMWASNHEASAAHLKIIRHFIAQVGGIHKLEPYVMESLILGDKYLALSYLALGKSVPPILPLDWDPRQMFPARVQILQITHNPVLDHLASALFALDEEVLSQDMQIVIADLVACLQIAHSICESPDADPADERWLFLRHQALIYRLLSTSTTNIVQECCRIALLVWMLKVTKYFGAQRCSRSLLPHLKDTLLKLEPDVVYANVELVFWITCVGAMTAEETQERDWYVRQTAQLASEIGLEPKEEQYKAVLRRYLFLKSEQGAQMTKLVRAVQMADLNMEGSDLVSPSGQANLGPV